MKIGSKEYYRDVFQQVLMTNFIASKSQPLSLTQSHYEEQIGNMATISPIEKALYLRNLQKAFDEIKHEVIGQSED